jgi:hypothetical protein
VVEPNFKWNSDDERWPLFRASWELDESNQFNFGHLFPIEFAGDLLVADFSKITTAGPADKARPIFLKAKRAEMTDRHRAAFQLKLAALFGRGG